MYARNHVHGKWHKLNSTGRTICGVVLTDGVGFDRTENRPPKDQTCAYCYADRERPTTYSYDPPNLRTWDRRKKS